MSQDVVVITHRSFVAPQIGRLLGYASNERLGRLWPPAEAFSGNARAAELFVIDVVSLLSSPITFLPRHSDCTPNLLVVGYRDDSDALITAWNEDIPAYPMEDLKAETLTNLLGQCGGARECYGYFGRRTAERVRDFLARRYEAKVLTPRERELVALLRAGHHRTYRIPRELGLAEKTIRNYLTSIYGKLGVSSRYELLAS